MTYPALSSLHHAASPVERIVANTLAIGTTGAAFDEWLLIRLASTEISIFLAANKRKKFRRTFMRRSPPFLRRLLLHPLWRAEQLDSMRGSRRGLFESHGRARFVCPARSSSAVASSRQAAQGYPENTGRDTRGGILLVTFLGRARKVTSRRAAPG